MPKNSLSTVTPELILKRVARGDLLREIGADYNCDHSAISHYVKANIDSVTWQQAKEHAIEARLERTLAEMESAPDMLTLARSRESARLWCWRAEREHPHRWGVRQQITHIQASYSDVLRSIDAETVVEQQQTDQQLISDTTDSVDNDASS